MENKMIKDLYDNYVESEEYGAADEIKKLNAKRNGWLNEVENIVGRDAYLDIEDFIASSNYAGELSGFIMGFKYAMQLAVEVGFIARSVTA